MSLRTLVSSILVLSLASSRAHGQWHDDAGPWFIATQGEPWPEPAYRRLLEQRHCLDLDTFDFKVVNQNCDILQEALERYENLMRTEFGFDSSRREPSAADEDCKSTISQLRVDLQDSSECAKYPRIDSNEQYQLSIGNNALAYLSADSIWGILRGLETFSQLLYRNETQKSIHVRGQEISDLPRFGHRGLLIDTSRHFLPVRDILLILDAMAYNKLNVLHWHLVDDNSFPYESLRYPELAQKGAYHPSMIYRVEDVARVVEHARRRGIRVLPELDTPGHTKSWGRSHPELLTRCYDAEGRATGKLGPMDPSHEPLYGLVEELLRELGERFPDGQVHLGGDEVLYDCWRSNPDIRDFMQRRNISLERYELLEEYYVERVLRMARQLGLQPVVWQEVFDNGLRLAHSTVVHVWTGDWPREMDAVTRAGHKALLSACWYLDHVAGGGDWLKYYRCDPLDFNATLSQAKQRDLVLGGEACMWGEFVDR
ncbi:hypothetical protein TKK_0015060 [Trichogramma kaykai]|uniref:Beta-hexosaminidase n=1 Tax=Trichogramma kaykai TaxID=54128 RepID=A0ABD2WCJ7_9HYME